MPEYVGAFGFIFIRTAGATLLFWILSLFLPKEKIKGEDYFRKIEEKVTLKILKNKSSIIALGGGAFINNEIRKEIIKNCCSIWLNLSLELLIKRYKRNNKRPLLERNNLESEVKKILQSRKKIYALANFKINCDNMNKKDVVQKILDLYAKN